MQSNYKTERLTLNRLTLLDVDFIFELINTEAWIKYIGDRNIKTREDAGKYVQKLIENSNITYWVVKLKGSQIAVGVITLIKRDYLEHHDIGFAFLTDHTKQGYAFEATLTVLRDLLRSEHQMTILATTIKENKPSIQLLKKLGFAFNKELKNGNELLHLFSVTEGSLSFD